MGADGGAVSQLLGLRGGEIALGLPVRVGRIVDDDGDQTTLAPAGLALGIGVVIGVARAGGETGRGGADTDGGEKLPAVHVVVLSVRARYSDLVRVVAGERLSARRYTVRRAGGRGIISRGSWRCGGSAGMMGWSIGACVGALVGGSPGWAGIRVVAARGRVCIVDPSAVGENVSRCGYGFRRRLRGGLLRPAATPAAVLEAVQQNGDDDHGTHEHRLPVLGHAHDPPTVREEADDARAPQGPARAATASAHRRTPD